MSLSSSFFYSLLFFILVWSNLHVFIALFQPDIINADLFIIAMCILRANIYLCLHTQPYFLSISTLKVYTHDIIE